MINFFAKIFKSSPFSPPEEIINALKDKFPDVINIEWNKSGDSYEAIFYKDNIEYIANFDKDGELKVYKMFLPEGFLPGNILDIVRKKGELMNAVMINKGNSITYEIIFRDTNLVRSVMLLNEKGAVLEERLL
jgi:hypothetical protein